ncbi:MAG: endonuclease III [Cytophagaceae bacterium]|nr:endonuclease III [Gemmatimonadaceae bacterium]
MAKGGNGPRQPLSQRKPGRAATKGPPPAAGKPKALKAAPPGRGPSTQQTVPARRKQRAARPQQKDLRAHADAIWNGLIALYPDAHCELDFRSPWELLVATILSAQCTDKRVNMVTPVLFNRWPDPAALAAAEPAAVEEVIKSTGFFRAKTKSIQGAATEITGRHGGHVPSTMPELVVLPGVGRKTANVVLGNAFGINEGVVVDTHVGRLAIRLGLTSETDPVKVEQVLMALFDRDRWTLLSHLLIWHGRRICDARRPKCEICPLNTICPSSLV